jgi:hypothetical protein
MFPDGFWGLSTFVFFGYQGLSLSLGFNGGNMNLTTHLHVMLRLRMIRAVPPLIYMPT